MFVRGFSGLGVWVLCSLDGSCLKHYRDLGLKASSRPAAFLNLRAGLGSFLYKNRSSIRRSTGRYGGNPLSRGDSQRGDFPLR